MIIITQTIEHIRLSYHGYFAGTGDGIVTIAGQPASRTVLLFDVTGGMSVPQIVSRVESLSNGHYLFMGLDPAKRYLVMCRDLPPNGVDQRYEPFCWDYIEPATDLTIAEQQAMWQKWADEAYQAQLKQG